MSNKPQWTSATDDLGRYLKELAKTPLLSKNQEIVVARKAKEGDVEARQRLVLHNLRFVVKIARELRPPRTSLLEVIAEGNLGLARAAEGFDPDKGVRFTTYAAYWIKEKIRCFLANQGGAVALPEKKHRQVRRLAATRHRLVSDMRRDPSENEVAREAGVELKEARRIEGAARPASPLEATSEECHATWVGVAHQVDHRQARRELQTDVERLLGNLPARERQCIRLYFGLEGDPPRTFREIGGLLALGKEGTRQVFKRGLMRLRTLPALENLRPAWAQ